MRCILGLVAVGLLMLLTSAGEAQPTWHPNVLVIAEALGSRDAQDPEGALYLYFDWGLGCKERLVCFGVDFPDVALEDCFVTKAEPVLVGDDDRHWCHMEFTPKYELYDVIPYDEIRSSRSEENPLRMWVDGYNRSRYAAKYVVLKRDMDFVLLPDAPSEYEMFSKARPISVSTNMISLAVLNQDEEHNVLYLSGTSIPNGAVFRNYCDQPDAFLDSVPPGVRSDPSQVRRHTIAYDTQKGCVVADFESPDFGPLYGYAGVVYGTDRTRKPHDTLVIRKLDNPAQVVSSQVLPLRAGDGIETVYPWKTGQLIVVTKQSVYTFDEATAKLTYVFDLVKPAQEAIAKKLAEEKQDQASEQEEAPAEGAGEH